MTVAVQTPQVSYAENGGSTEFPVPFRYFAPGDLRALRRDADGVETPLTNGADFTATAGNSDAGGTLTVAEASSGTTLVIWRETARAQTEDYIANGPFKAEAHEGALDKLMLLDQEAALDDARAVKVPRGEAAPAMPSAAVRANKLTRFDNAGGFALLTMEELAVLLEPEKAAGLTLAFTELAGARSQVVVFHPDGVGEGGYPVEFSAQAATSFVRAYAKVFAGDGTCDVRVLGGGLQLWSTSGLDATPVDEVIAQTLPQGADLIVVIENVVGTVTGVVVKLEGAVA